MLKKQIRYLSRYQDILSALYHYGFGHIVRDLGLLEKARIRKKSIKTLTIQWRNEFASY